MSRDRIDLVVQNPMFCTLRKGINAKGDVLLHLKEFFGKLDFVLFFKLIIKVNV